jgi:hypothetical protein
VLSRRIDEFLGARGYRGESDGGTPLGPGPAASDLHTTDISTPSAFPAAPKVATPPESVQPPLEFVCEEDVRSAIRAGRKLVISERAIVTPSARDLAEAHRVLTFASFRG